MLNKEMMLCGGGKKWTHKVTVGKWYNSNRWTHGYDKSRGIGSVTPTTLFGYDFYRIDNITNGTTNPNGQMALYRNGSEVDYRGSVRVTRLDTGETAVYSYNATYEWPLCTSTKLFKTSDFEKTIELKIEAI